MASRNPYTTGYPGSYEMGSSNHNRTTTFIEGLQDRWDRMCDHLPSRKLCLLVGVPTLVVGGLIAGVVYAGVKGSENYDKKLETCRDRTAVELSREREIGRLEVSAEFATRQPQTVTVTSTETVTQPATAAVATTTGSGALLERHLDVRGMVAALITEGKSEEDAIRTTGDFISALEVRSQDVASATSTAFPDPATLAVSPTPLTTYVASIIDGAA